MNSSDLPKGIYSVWDDTIYGVQTEMPPKCTCGWSITLGKDDIPEGHPDDCELKKYLTKNKLTNKIEPIIT